MYVLNHTIVELLHQKRGRVVGLNRDARTHLKRKKEEVRQRKIGGRKTKENRRKEEGRRKEREKRKKEGSVDDNYTCSKSLFSKKRHRVMKINFLVDVAKECYNIGNFNSLMAILAGLNLAPVIRLRKTWAKIDREKLNALEHQVSE